jgi:hypothetical protein
MEREVSVEARQIYLLLGERSLKLAEKRISDLRKIENMREKILLAKKKLRC